jgi:hypothetical protein
VLVQQDLELEYDQELEELELQVDKSLQHMLESELL